MLRVLIFRFLLPRPRPLDIFMSLDYIKSYEANSDPG